MAARGEPDPVGCSARLPSRRTTTLPMMERRIGRGAKPRRLGLRTRRVLRMDGIGSAAADLSADGTATVTVDGHEMTVTERRLGHPTATGLTSSGGSDSVACPVVCAPYAVRVPRIRELANASKAANTVDRNKFLSRLQGPPPHQRQRRGIWAQSTSCSSRTSKSHGIMLDPMCVRWTRRTRSGAGDGGGRKRAEDWAKV